MNENKIVLILKILTIILLIPCLYFTFKDIKQDSKYWTIDEIVECIDNGTFEIVDIKSRMEGKYTREHYYIIYRTQDGTYKENEIYKVNDYYQLKDKYQK